MRDTGKRAFLFATMSLFRFFLSLFRCHMADERQVFAIAPGRSAVATVKTVLAAGFVCVVILQAAFHVLKTWEVGPYERFDEIAAFNNAHVLVGSAAARTPRYGSIDTILQWAAIIGYNSFSVTGATYSHIQYSNNVPQSWDDPLLAYRTKNWPGVDYWFFRGVDDRYPIFISRIFHLLVFYFIVLLTGLLPIKTLGARAAYILMPLLLLTTAKPLYDTAAQSLPNAINTALAFMIVVFAMVFADRSRTPYLLLAAAAFAVGVNVKPDIIIIGGSIGLALLLALLYNGLSFTLRATFMAALVFAVVLGATNPQFLINPVNEINVIYKAIHSQADYAPREGYIAANFDLLKYVLNNSLLWVGAGLTIVLASAVLMVIFVGACLRRTRSYLILVIGASVALTAWASPILISYVVFDRYLFNGLGAFLATVAMGLLLLEGSGRRVAANVVLATGMVVYCFHVASLSRESLTTYVSYRPFEGLDPEHHRNLAVLYAIKTAKAGGFSHTVLVDQHAYIDLRQFRISGIEAKYINSSNIQTVISGLPREKNYIAIYGKGDYGDCQKNLGWAGGWTPELMRAYDNYQARLAQLPILQRYPGPAQCLMSLDPLEMQRNTDLTVAVLSPS